MSVATACSSRKQVNEAVSELQGQLSSILPKMVIYFASSEYAPQEVSAAMQKAFPGTTVFGCSTSGEIISGKMLKGSIVAMAFNKDIIEDIVVQVVPEIKTSSKLRSAFAAFEDHFDITMHKADPSKYVGIVLFDGLSCAEERLMDKIGDFSDVTFIGGSAGDDLKFTATYVYANGQAYTDAAILALIKAKGSFDVIKTQSFNSLGKKLVATKVDEKTRTVYEFDGDPAALAYAAAVGKSVSDLAKDFMAHPLGLMVDGEPFVRSPQQVKDGSVVFYCNVKEGMELEVLQATDIVQKTAEAVKNKEKEMGSLKAMLNFNCILRTLQLESEGKTEEYGKVFANVPTVGFSTYGEAYIGHINQTATILVFA
jgi:hypothetical protein